MSKRGCYTSDNGHDDALSARPLWAKSGHLHRFNSLSAAPPIRNENPPRYSFPVGF